MTSLSRSAGCGVDFGSGIPMAQPTESLNAHGCDAIHITEIETNIDCDTFIPSINALEFQPWYSPFLLLENGICHSFTTYLRVRNSRSGPILPKSARFSPVLKPKSTSRESSRTHDLSGSSATTTFTKAISDHL
ncbi:hypothetical protein L1887_19183 [Cichorium endivia]|nr:hypothetical protein L1887_19183 [Cichorium endivia]